MQDKYRAEVLGMRHSLYQTPTKKKRLTVECEGTMGEEGDDGEDEGQLRGWRAEGENMTGSVVCCLPCRRLPHAHRDWLGCMRLDRRHCTNSGLPAVFAVVASTPASVVSRCPWTPYRADCRWTSDARAKWESRRPRGSTGHGTALTYCVFSKKDPTGWSNVANSRI